MVPLLYQQDGFRFTSRREQLFAVSDRNTPVVLSVNYDKLSSPRMVIAHSLPNIQRISLLTRFQKFIDVLPA
jgi:hypothetical protein